MYCRVSTWTSAQAFTVCSAATAWNRTLADELIADFVLGDALATRYGPLSRGQRAMVTIIIGLASSTEVLLLDEPYVGLDTHHIDDAARVLDDAVILGRGGVVVKRCVPEDADEFAVAGPELVPISDAPRHARAATFDDLIEHYLEVS